MKKNVRISSSNTRTCGGGAADADAVFAGFEGDGRGPGQQSRGLNLVKKFARLLADEQNAAHAPAHVERQEVDADGAALLGRQSYRLLRHEERFQAALVCRDQW